MVQDFGFSNSRFRPLRVVTKPETLRLATCSRPGLGMLVHTTEMLGTVGAATRAS